MCPETGICHNHSSSAGVSACTHTHITVLVKNSPINAITDQERLGFNINVFSFRMSSFSLVSMHVTRSGSSSKEFYFSDFSREFIHCNKYFCLLEPTWGSIPEVLFAQPILPLALVASYSLELTVKNWAAAIFCFFWHYSWRELSW